MKRIAHLIECLKNKAKTLKNEIATIYYAYQNPKTPLLPKIIILFTLGYALSPIDFIPDFIPILGCLDDLIIIPALITLSIKLIPKEIMDESKELSLKKPLQLKKNYFFALLFIFIWITLLTVILIAILKLLGILN